MHTRVSRHPSLAELTDRPTDRSTDQPTNSPAIPRRTSQSIKPLTETTPAVCQPTAQHSTAQHLPCLRRTLHDPQPAAAARVCTVLLANHRRSRPLHQSTDRRHNQQTTLAFTHGGKGREEGRSSSRISGSSSSSRKREPRLDWSPPLPSSLFLFPPPALYLPACAPTYLPTSLSSPLLSSPLGRPIGQHDRPPGTLSPTHWTMHCYHN